MKNYIYSIAFFLLASFLQAQEKEMSLSMKQAVDYAIKNNYSNKVALNDIEAAKQRKWETTTIGLPQISANADYQNFIELPTSLIPAQFFGGNEGEFAEVVCNGDIHQQNADRVGCTRP